MTKSDARKIAKWLASIEVEEMTSHRSRLEDRLSGFTEKEIEKISDALQEIAGRFLTESLPAEDFLTQEGR